MNDGRTIPPRRGRLAAAARAGLFPRSALLSTGAVLLTGAFVVRFALRDIDALAVLLFRRVLERTPAIEAMNESLMLFGRAVLLITVPLTLIMVLAALLPAIAARKERGQTAVDLPKPPRLWPTQLVLRGLGLVIFVALSLQIGRNQLLNIARLQAFDLSATAALVQGLTSWLALAGCVALVVGICEFVVARAAIKRVLYLSTTQERRERRAHDGAQESKLALHQRNLQETTHD